MEAETRRRIRSAAVQLFAKKGYAATATREICQRAGVTKPVLYYHFENKERLYTSLLVDAWQDCRRELILAGAGGKTARQKLIDVLAADLEHTRRNPGLSAMLFRMVFAPQKESLSIDVVQFGRNWANLIAGIVRGGIRKGEMQGSPKEIGIAILGVHIIYTLSFLLTGKPKPDRRLARRIVDLMTQGCARRRHRSVGMA